MNEATTICAIASSLGRGGIGVVRVSGSLCEAIAKQMLGFVPKARYAHYGTFFNQDGVAIDKGIALFFPCPHSFTGEDVLEFQGHGGASVMHALLSSNIALGAVAATPGEFSKRAFLNGKMDLLQAEAVADIIDAGSEQAARCALRSLSGEFSIQINKLVKVIIQLRVFVEATIDFAEEAIDFLQAEQVRLKVEAIKDEIVFILQSAQQGAILREGLNVAIVGKPNVGKSSLLNALTQNERAIVTDIAGTTRDVIKETIYVNGMPLNIIDTAGLHQSADAVEQIGIRKAHTEIEHADVILLLFDARDKAPDYSILPSDTKQKPLVLIKNKIDLIDEHVAKSEIDNRVQLCLSAKNAKGIDLLKQVLVDIAGLHNTGEGIMLARKRHITALETALKAINNALMQLEHNAIEMVAEDLRHAGQAMGSITGEFSSDDLLGEIFSSFCIGK